ncbi:hypothetical protein J437_LFUL009470 [Ladona fulva]|uniref:RBD domain-containing protein n=1 Tax=Ladona fulva TaxID=123851 RepID=A0A8K0KTI7_LADFU|nr:hypothetical protein J437_LFUL009470 [Ladona fulva]
MAVVRESRYNGTVPTLSLNSPTKTLETEVTEALHDELRNIRSVIRLTRENIDALNEKFAGFQHPPSMYLSNIVSFSSIAFLFPVNVIMTIKGHYEPFSFIRNDNSSSLKWRKYGLFEGLLLGLCVVGRSCSPLLGGSDDSPSFAPRSPLKSVVRAHLPNQQRTSVQVRQGQSVRDALSKAMKLRKLTPEMCVVYRGESKILIPWEADISTLEGEEISVEIMDKFPITTSISHNFVSKWRFVKLSLPWHSVNAVGSCYSMASIVEPVAIAFIKGALQEYLPFVSKSGCKILIIRCSVKYLEYHVHICWTVALGSKDGNFSAKKNI